MVAKKGEHERVIVEYRIPEGDSPRSAMQLGASAFGAAGFQTDESYEPVPVPAEPGEPAARAEAERQQTVLVRGTVAVEKRSDLESQDNVVKVWTDVEVQPFAAGIVEPELVQIGKKADMAACPIPPCDCSPGTAKGDLADVRRYLGVDHIWARGHKGKGVVVGVVDGGITTPARVSGGKIPNVVGGVKSDWGMKALWGGHGEMCATDVLGMAAESKLYDLRLPDGADSIGAVLSDAIAAFHWSINRHRSDGTPQILTNSWGIFQKSWDPDYATNPNHPFTRKVVEAVNEGICVLFAAGNCGGTCPDGRCASDNGPAKSIWGANGHHVVMTVGAANIKEELVGYSSQGPAALDRHKPDFCSITHFKGYFASDSGTSAACPIAAGVVALLKQCKPGLAPEAAKQVLKATAKNIGPAGWDQHSGSGIIQAKAAYERVGCSGGETSECDRYKERALKCQALYKRTKQRKYLCCFYQYAAYHFRCLYQQKQERAYLCRFYYYSALYYRCRYGISKDCDDYCNFRTYERAYKRCAAQS